MIQAVIFDMDGLMFDTERITMEAIDQAGRHFGYPDISELRPSLMGVARRHQAKYYFDRYGERFPFEEYIAYRQKLIDAKAQDTGELVKPGLRELLSYLRREGYATAVATSTTSERVAKYLRLTEVAGFFDKVINGDMVEKSKPDPEIYCKAAAALEIPPECCMALEDSPNGIRSARAAGMVAVMVPDTLEPDEEILELAYAKVPSLFEVIPLLELLKAAPEAAR